jgi:hypothetical protein
VTVGCQDQYLGPAQELWRIACAAKISIRSQQTRAQAGGLKRRKFCKQSRELLLKRRWPERRLEFVREYIFAPKHADILDSRECKRAREAQAEQEKAEQRQAVKRTSPRLLALFPQPAAGTTAGHLLIARDSRKGRGHASFLRSVSGGKIAH